MDADSAATTKRVCYRRLPAELVTDEQLQECSNLFFANYGVWGPGSRNPGSPVRLSAARLRAQYLYGDNTCTLSTAELDGRLVGYAVASHFPYSGSNVSWITQLCVNSSHRSCGIGSTLCRWSWDITSDFACGLASSHPHAVRALERATQRRCNPELTLQHAQSLVEASAIPYLQGCAIASTGACTINTSYFVDHADVNRLAAAAPDWRLGALAGGEEYLAVTFMRTPPAAQAATGGGEGG